MHTLFASLCCNPRIAQFVGYEVGKTVSPFGTFHLFQSDPSQS